eukprot:CAMPEP_0115257766 /NCGR_PEP_ID=MMETSP0270-20121206/46945_1 /TAXON_ID=71861 /ORGANISM="Scrippsiella trochoidea, Strain CCMP3099" /LENGTH=195 /DNA_ID=CAMNT_0002673489 /DNA_START=26 /DNA_END=613 /DNA_ORIENTATION=-
MAVPSTNFALAVIVACAAASLPGLLAVDTSEEAGMAETLHADAECAALGGDGEQCALSALQYSAAASRARAAAGAMRACPTDILVGTWKAVVLTNIIITLDIKPEDSGTCTGVQTAILNFPGAKVTYEIKVPLTGEKVQFKFANNADANPYFHPGEFDPKTMKIVEHLDHVGHGESVQYTGGAMGVSTMVFSKEG